MKTERQCKELRDALLWEARNTPESDNIVEALIAGEATTQKIIAAEILDWVMDQSQNEDAATAMLERVAKRRASA